MRRAPDQSLLTGEFLTILTSQALFSLRFASIFKDEMHLEKMPLGFGDCVSVAELWNLPPAMVVVSSKMQTILQSSQA